ncbi:MAG: undecaprenyl-phosphate glucose phosphotransferase [bacterium]|nr:undecaprenyl-phosphate glucose phosphotransferase [bacterium]
MRRGLLREHSNSLILVLRIFDIITVLISAYIAYYIRFDNFILKTSYIRALIVIGLICIIIFSSFSLYKSWRGASLIYECYSVLSAWTISVLLYLMIIFLFKAGINFSRIWTLEMFLIGTLLLITGRILLRNTLKSIRGKGYNQRSVCLIASGNCGKKVFKHLSTVLKSGFRISATFSDEQTTYSNSNELNTLENWLSNNHVDQIWIAIPFNEAKKIEAVFYAARHVPIDIRLVPDLFAFKLLNHSITDVDGLPVINLHATPMGTGNLLLKRLEDLFLSNLALICLSPLFVIIALVIKITSPGPVFYRQTRIGLNNKPFQILKFRSMPIDIEKNSGAKWAKPGENRATPFGSFLRKTSLDEIPQFINVLKGEMSVVGPRPERPEFINDFKEKIPEYMKKHMVKAGITGWAQVNGWRGNTDLKKRIDYDLFYIENWSLLMDLKILLLTVIKGFINKNAY